MTSLQSFIQKGESEHLEFKTSFGKEAIEALCAFANTIIPDAETFAHEDKTVISLSVISYPIKPISFKGKYFKRVHNANHLMDLNEIANEHLRTINDDPLTVLKKFELLRENAVSFGCFLLFCDNPSMISTIDAGRFDSETIIKDSITIRNDLFSEVEACMDFIRKHISKRFVISGKPQRDEVWEYPLDAVREIIVNMIVHRDYQAQGDSTIKIFQNRIEFFNPGSLPKGMTMNDILSGRLASNPRNKQIASIFKEAGIIEKYGSGIKRVLQSMAEAGSPVPLFETIADNFKVTLFPMGEITGGGVSGGVNNLLDFIKANPGKKSKDIKATLNLPQRTLERWLKELREQKKIKFHGPPKTGGYYFLDEKHPNP